MVVLFVHQTANAHHQQHVKGHQQMEPQGRYGGLNDDLAEISDKEIHRVQKKSMLNQRAVAINGIEDGGHVHQQLGKYTPEILNIPEEHVERGKDQTYTDVEVDKETDGIDQHDPAPGERDPVQNAEQHKHAQRQPEVDETLHVLGKQEQILGYIHLGEYPGVV